MTLDHEAVEQAKAAVCAAVDARREELLAISHGIHAEPELGFEEHRAHDRLTAALVGAGLDVTRHAHGMDTAFVAEAGEAGPLVALLCEYDALPGLGHACGHNIIAASGVGAAIAAAAVGEQLAGRVRVLGSPAEEGGGGKVRLIEAGAFEGVHAALMVHPAGSDLTRMDAIAIQQLEVQFSGRASHAAAAPWEGANALDAAVLAYSNVAALRQHIRPDERIHGIFTDGGDKPNIVPDRAAQHWYVRAGTIDALGPLKERVLACLSAGALATGCTMTHRWIEPAYAELRDNAPLVACYVANAARLGRQVTAPDASSAVTGSTDMGNVSHVVAAIHPTIAAAPPDVAIHTPAFAEHAAGPQGDQAVLDGAKALAMTVVDVWADPGLVAR